MNTLTIDVRNDTGRPILFLAGKLTAATAGHLQTACLKAIRQINAGELVIDMAGLDYIDSLSMGRLVALNKAAAEDGKIIVLANPQAPLRDAFRMLHLDRLIVVR
jgi:anti-anti-sigma factor